MRLWRLVAGLLATLAVVAGAPGKDSFDPYAVLGVSRDADDATIKKAYRKLSLKHHPDKVKSDDERAAAEAKFADIAKAYEILSDASARQANDIGAFTNAAEWEEWKRKNSKAAAAAAGKGLYPLDGPVQPWGRKELLAGVSDRSKPIAIMFYAPWCTHCQQFAPEYRKVALELADTAVIAAVDCEADSQLCQQEQIAEFPTLRLLTPAPDMGVEPWTGPLVNSDEVVQWILAATSNEVIPLSSELFKSKVMKSKLPWLIIFSAGPWCQPCNSVKSPARVIAAKLKGRLNVGMVSCDQHTAWCLQMGVQIYPLFRIFPPSPTDKAKMYEGRGQDIFLPQDGFMNPPMATLNLLSKVFEAVLPTESSASGKEAKGKARIKGNNARDRDADRDL